MIEEIVQNYLSSKLQVAVRMEEETDLQAEYVLIEKTGGGGTSYIKRATLAIQSYAATRYKAAAINEEVKNAMENIVGLNEISKCTLNTDYDYTDTTRKKYRYQAVFDIVHY